MERKVIALGLTLIIVVGLFGYEAATAEVIHLKDGSAIKGEVVSATTDSLDVRTSYGMLRIGKDNVLRIEFDGAQPSDLKLGLPDTTLQRPEEKPLQQEAEAKEIDTVWGEAVSALRPLIGLKVNVKRHDRKVKDVILVDVSNTTIKYRTKGGAVIPLDLSVVEYVETWEEKIYVNKHLAPSPDSSTKKSVLFAPGVVGISAYGGRLTYTSMSPVVVMVGGTPVFKDVWGSGALVVGGWILYGIRPGSSLGVEISETIDSETTDVEGYPVDYEATTFSFMISCRQVIDSYDPVALYGIGGIGFCHMSVKARALGLSVDENRDDFAYETGIGLSLWSRINVEGLYFSGQRNGNTGLRFNLGLGLTKL